MKLKRLVANNFLSFGTIQIDFEKLQGLTIIEGVNKDSNPVCSNGSGKSSLWEAVTFGLFGRTIRKTRESSIVRHNAKSCTVDLEIDMDGTNVFIQRGRKPSKLFVSIDGKDITRESAIETQKFLCEYLNLDFTTYLAAVMFGQNNNSDFINSSPADKRKILQAFLGINDYFEIREVVRVNKKQHKRNITELEGEKKAHLKHIESAKKKQENAKKVEPIEDCEQKLKNWKEYTQAKRFVEEERNKLVTLKNKFKKAQDKIDKIEDTGRCPTCKQKLRGKAVKETAVIERDSLEEAIKVKEEMIKDPLRPNHETVDEIKDYEAYLKYQESVDSIQSIIEESEAELEIVHKSLEEETRQLILCEYWEQAFSEQGLVKYIIRNIIDFFNTQVNYYLSLITNGHLTITFSQSLSETIFSGKSLVEYNAMSGGERKKVNLAVMLGLHDLLRFNKKSTPDFAIFDEITEIDQAGIRNISSLMKKIAEEHNKKVFMITHNPDLLGEIDKYNKVVVQKRNGKSKIKEIKYAG